MLHGSYILTLIIEAGSQSLWRSYVHLQYGATILDIDGKLLSMRAPGLVEIPHPSLAQDAQKRPGKNL